MSYVKNIFYLFFLIYFLSGCTGEQPKHEREQNNKLTLNISGGEFENTVLNLDPTFANYGEDNDHFLIGFIAVVDNDTTVFNLMFKGQSPGVFPIERNDTTEGGFGNGFSFIRWIGNEKPGSRYFIISESGEINIEKLGNAGEEIVGSFKGYAYDIKFEVPKDSFYIEGTFSAIRGEEKVALY
jgi:hypothetical protein